MSKSCKNSSKYSIWSLQKLFFLSLSFIWRITFELGMIGLLVCYHSLFNHSLFNHSLFNHSYSCFFSVLFFSFHFPTSSFTSIQPWSQQRSKSISQIKSYWNVMNVLFCWIYEKQKPMWWNVLVIYQSREGRKTCKNVVRK